MSPPRQLIDDLRRAKIAQAEAMHPFDLALAGAKLYDVLRERMAWGVLMEHPNATPEEVERIVHERLDQARARDQLRGKGK